MAYYLDYSAAKLSGATIKNAGYTGVIRYIDSPANLGTKHTNKSEYDSHRAAGLGVLLVMQTTTTASDGGVLVGQDHARRALAGANYLGYTGPIFFTNDRTTVPNPNAWRAYLDGAVSVLGIGRVGAYGFRNAMDLAIGHASFFWQAGRRSDVAAHTHVWQDNNVQVQVGGITCDRNLILKPIQGVDDVEQSDLIYNPSTGQPAKDTNGNNYTVGQVLYYDNLNGWAIRSAVDSVAGKVADLVAVEGAVQQYVTSLVEAQAALAAKVDALQLAGVDVNALAQALLPLLPTAKDVADEIDRRNRDGNPATGQVS